MTEQSEELTKLREQLALREHKIVAQTADRLAEKGTDRTVAERLGTEG